MGTDFGCSTHLQVHNRSREDKYGKALKDIIEGWYFDDANMKIRQSISHLPIKEIHALDDVDITNAIIPPKMTRPIAKMFKFLLDNQNLVTSTNGMDSFITGMDKYKLMAVSKLYNIDLSRWMFAVDIFENSFMKTVNRRDN